MDHVIIVKIFILNIGNKPMQMLKQNRLTVFLFFITDNFNFIKYIAVAILHYSTSILET